MPGSAQPLRPAALADDRPLAGRLFGWPAWARTQPEQAALIVASDAGQPLTLSWRQLALATATLADRLAEDDWRPGDRLLHTAGNSAAGVILALASAALGTIEVAVSGEADSPWLADVAERVQGRWLDQPTLDRWLAPTIEQAAQQADRQADSPTAQRAEAAVQSLLERLSRQAADDASLILMTSGSSGRPQAVVLSRRNLSSNAAAKLAAVPQRRDDVRLTLLPISHAYARTSDLGSWLISGCTLAIGLGWDGWTTLAERVRPSLLNAVPSLAMRLAELPLTSPAMARLRLLGCGGAALPAERFEQFRRRGITVIQGYGLTEAGPVICSATPHNARPGLVGRPVAGWQTRLDDDGRLWVKGDAMMLGYWQDPAGTAERIIDGWLDTGDIVEVDPTDGQFRIVGRADDRLVLENGLKLYPAPIQQRVAALPGVRHALLVTAGRHPELWLDADPAQEPAGGWHRAALAQLADLPAWQWPRRTRLLPPLAATAGLLTAKGTPVRPRVIQLIQSAW